MMNVNNYLALYSSNALQTLASNSSSSLKMSETKELDEKELSFDKALKEQTDAFEAFLVKEVLDISMKNKASLFEKDASDEIYSSMYNDTMSKALSGGMGFSELLFNFLKERA